VGTTPGQLAGTVPGASSARFTGCGQFRKEPGTLREPHEPQEHSTVNPESNRTFSESRRTIFGIRISGFGFLSDFGIRISDLKL
jgi:hypothetical protein